MAAVNFLTFDAFLTEMALGKDGTKFNLNTDTLSIYLTNATPNRATHSTKADLADINAENGYDGMIDLTITSRGISNNAWRIVATDPPTWEGNNDDDNTGFGPFQHVILLSKTSSATDANRALIGYWSYPSAITVADGDFFKVDFNATTGMFRLQSPC
jgi:hypothetical protein